MRVDVCECVVGCVHVYVCRCMCASVYMLLSVCAFENVRMCMRALRVCVYASVCARGKLKVCTVTTQVQASEGVQEEDWPSRCSSGSQAPLNLW